MLRTLHFSDFFGFFGCSVYQKSVAVVLFELCQKSKKNSSDLTELIQGVKSVRVKIENKRERNKDIFLEFHCLCQLKPPQHKNLFNLKFKTGSYFKMFLKNFVRLENKKVNIQDPVWIHRWFINPTGMYWYAGDFIRYKLNTTKYS